MASEVMNKSFAYQSSMYLQINAALKDEERFYTVRNNPYPS